jgi:hypothetical protein
MINYTPIVLFLLGVLGILLHNLVEMNKLNKAQKGHLKIRDYLRLEVFSIAISLIVVLCAVITSQEIKQIHDAGKWLGLAFVTIGYMGQSLLIFVMGKAQKTIDGENKNPQ